MIHITCVALALAPLPPPPPSRRARARARACRCEKSWLSRKGVSREWSDLSWISLIRSVRLG